MVVVQLLNHRFRIGKDVGVEGELAVVGVPARRAEAGAEVDHRVARQLLLAEGLRFLKHLLAAGERAMRLLVAERPQRRHLRMAGEPRVLAHDRRRLPRADHEEIERQGGWTRPRQRVRHHEPPVCAGQIECAVRLMDEHRPAAGVDQPLHRHAAAMRAQLVAALAATGADRRSAAIELRSALAEAEHRTAAEEKRHGAGFLIDAQPLHDAAVRGRDGDSKADDLRCAPTGCRCGSSVRAAGRRSARPARATARRSRIACGRRTRRRTCGRRPG